MTVRKTRKKTPISREIVALVKKRNSMEVELMSSTPHRWS